MSANEFQPNYESFFIMKMYGIPNCDTIKKARKFLDTHQVEYRFHDFKKQGIDMATIQQWLSSVPITSLINKRSTTWRQLTDEQKAALTATTSPNANDLNILVEHPTLIKRPVLVTEKTILVGFKEAEYRSISGKLSD